MVMKKFIKYVGGAAAWFAIVVFFLGGSEAGIIIAAGLGAMIGLIGMLIRAAALGWEAVGNELDEKVIRWWNRR